MSHELIQAMRRIRGDLHPAEDSIDVALGHVGRLLATTCEARVSAGVTAVVGRQAIDELLAGTHLLGEVRGRVLAAHESFVDTAREQLPELGFGDLGKCPKQEGSLTRPATQPLRVVPG